MSNTISYYEKQSFRYGWPWWVILLITVGISIGSVLDYYEIVDLTKEGAEIALREKRIAGFFGVLILFVVLALFHFMRLEIWVDDYSLSYRYFPFKKKTTFKEGDVLKMEVIQYSPLGEYGGWGVRYGFSSGWAYNIKGNKGLRLLLASNKKLLLGTQKEEELKDALVKLKEKWRM
jgi:hypothetical protein